MSNGPGPLTAPRLAKNLLKAANTAAERQLHQREAMQGNVQLIVENEQFLWDFILRRQLPNNFSAETGYDKRPFDHLYGHLTYKGVHAPGALDTMLVTGSGADIRRDPWHFGTRIDAPEKLAKLVPDWTLSEGQIAVLSLDRTIGTMERAHLEDAIVTYGIAAYFLQTLDSVQ